MKKFPKLYASPVWHNSAAVEVGVVIRALSTKKRASPNLQHCVNRLEPAPAS